MSSMTRIAVLIAVVLLTTGSRCGGSEDDVVSAAVRLMRGQGDDAARAGAKLDDLWIVLRQAPETDPAVLAARRIEATALAASIPEEIRGAYHALGWDATCALAFGNVPADASQLAAWLENWAWRYGIAYLPGGAQDHAVALLDAMMPEGAWSDAQQLCSQAGTIAT